MCLYPRLLINKKYIPTKKNNFNPPVLKDERLKYVAVPCGNCMECRKQKSREWKIRLFEEIQVNKYKYFVTLTFSNENLKKLCEETGEHESNAIAGIAVRRFLERWRKKHKKSLKHWLITELGHENTERIHLHGIIFNDQEITNEKLQYYWKYGITDIGRFCNNITIGYITKYVTKIDAEHKGFKPAIYTTAGIGKTYLEKGKRLNRYKGKDTQEYYEQNNGKKINLPTYYKNNIYTEDEREKLWINKIEQHKRFVNGIEINNIDTEKGIIQLERVLEEQQRINRRLGYGDTSKEWKKKDYNITLRMLNAKSKLQNTQKKAKNIT